MTKARRNAIILILGALSALGPFTIDMYLPGFSVIAADLHTTISTVGYSLTSYFIGISVGQLIYGPVTDRFGRKEPLIIGLGIYVAATIACALSPTVEWLIGARLITALGACVGIVASRAVVRDLFPVKEMAGIFSTYMLVIAASPMLAPTVGGYVSANLGWRVIFYILTGMAIAIAVVVIAWLPESKAPDHEVSLRPGSIIKRYVSVGADRQFIIFAIASGLSMGGLLAYVAGAPFLLMHLLGLSQTQFAWGFAVNAIGLIAGSQVNRRLLKQFTARQITNAAVGAQLFFGSILVLGAFLHIIPVAGVFSLLFCFLFVTGLVNPNSSALAIEPFQTHAGSASGLLGCLQMGVAAVASALVSMFANGTALPMMLVIWGSAMASFVMLQTLGRKQAAAIPASTLQ